VWINIFPHKPVTQKPAETRMGSGKGNPEFWVAVVKPGRVMFELSGVPEELAREAMRKAGHKLPVEDPVRHPGGAMNATELREMSRDELEERLRGQGGALQPPFPDGHQPAGQHGAHEAPSRRRRPHPHRDAGAGDRGLATEEEQGDD
jgi:hypothetical protein